MAYRRSMRAFRFGVVCTGNYGASAWTSLSRRVEGLGFATLLLADHYVNPMACGPLMLAAAMATTDLRVGSYVYNNDFRSPALLAKEAATIDVLSEGRLELGIGAGWAKIEYLAAGLRFDEPKVRADRFEEAVGVIRRLLAGEAVEHRGEHYRLRGLAGMPLPVQHRIPLLIGGGGPRMLRFAAREADIVGFVPQSLPGGGLDPKAFTAAAMDARIDRLARGLDERPSDRAAPERSVVLFAVGDAEPHDPAVAALDDDERAVTPYVLGGGNEQMIEALQYRRDRWGLSYIVCFDRDLDRLAPVVAALTGN